MSVLFRHRGIKRASNHMWSPSELRFPVPWGHVAAVGWGNPQEKLVLMVHGTLDNSGSFKRLIPHLPENLYYICIDLPGHGLSSHFPQGMHLDFMNYVLTLHYILDELKCQNCLYVGHSFGAQLGVMYAILYPGRIEKMVAIDALLCRAQSPAEVIERMRTVQEATLFALEKKDANLYTKDEVLDAIMNKRRFKINEAAAEALFERAVTDVGGKFKYNRDVRMRTHVALSVSDEQNMEFMQNLKTQVLLIVANDSWYKMIGKIKVIEDYREKFSMHFSVVSVEGNHDVHNNTPEVVAPHVIAFFGSDTKKSKL